MAEVYIRTDANTGVVTFIHKQPFDPVHGLNKTKDELSKTGFFINDFPEPANKFGMKAIAYYDHEKKEVHYEYEPSTKSEKKRIEELEDTVNTLTMLVGQLQEQISAPANGISVMSLEEDNSSKSILEYLDYLNRGGKPMSANFAKYLSTQIFLRKLDKEMVLNSYPEIRSEIESLLEEMDVVPVIPTEDKE